MLVDTLGERSFGWCLVIFSLINLLPVPVGTNMITSIPVIAVTAQMALGYDRVRLPGFITRRQMAGDGSSGWCSGSAP